MNWPEQKVVVRLTAQHATKIRQAFKSAIDGDAIAQSWAETHPTGGLVSPQTARDWALAHAIANEKPLQHALSRVYADGYTLGAKVAQTRLNGLKKDATPSVNIIDWNTWKPGLPSAAALVKPRGGLKQLLDSRKITIANEITRTKLDRIGTALSRSLSKGDTAKETAKAINAIIGDPQHALTIARTEMNRAMSVATRDSYESAQVEQVEWLVAEGCEDCQDNADASPINIDDTFPSGDSEPPAHPNCMCALAPYYDYSPVDSTEQTDITAEDFVSQGEDFASSITDEMPVIEEPEINFTLNEPAIKNVTYSDELMNKIFTETKVNHLSVREINNLPQDVIAESISRLQGFNALPKVVTATKFDDLVGKEKWIPIYRGVGGKTKAEVDGYVNEFKSAPTQFGGRGIYGSGTYTAENRGVAQHFSEANGAKNGELHAFGRVMDMAINPKAKIVDYDVISKATKGQVEKLRKTSGAMYLKEYAKALKIIAKKEGISIKTDEYGRKVLDTDKFIVRETNEYGNTRIDYDKSDFDSVSRIDKELQALTKEFLAKTDYEKLAFMADEGLYVNVGNRAALEGVDVIRVPKPEYSRDDSGNLSDYYIVLNRGAIAVRE